MFVVFLRFCIGLIFVASGLEKVLSPYQNFMYVVQAYQILPGWTEMLVARVFPWVELFVGIFLVLGLWTRWAAKAALVMFAVFVTVVGQALLRGLPLDQCGCFGEWIHISPRIIIVIDSFMLLLTIWLLSNPSKMQRLSLDKYCSQ
jgi:hypothetical protein